MASLRFQEKFPDNYFKEDILWQALWVVTPYKKTFAFLVMIVHWEALSYNFCKFCVLFCLLFY